ncbi:hypothetical protein IC582_020388 [Cucumis melo]
MHLTCFCSRLSLVSVQVGSTRIICRRIVSVGFTLSPGLREGCLGGGVTTNVDWASDPYDKIYLWYLYNFWK